MTKKDFLKVLFNKSNLKDSVSKINSRISYLNKNNIIFIVSEETNIMDEDDFYLVKFEIDKFAKLLGLSINDIQFVVFDRKSLSLIDILFPNNKKIFVYDKNIKKLDIENIKNKFKDVIFKYVNNIKNFDIFSYIVLLDLDEHYVKRNFLKFDDDIIVLKLKTGVDEIQHSKINFSKVKVDKPNWVYDSTSGVWIHSFGRDGLEIVKGY